MTKLESSTIPGLEAQPEEVIGNGELDQFRHWKPLLDTLGEALAEHFDWKAETDTIQTYEHRLTFRYIHIDGATNRFYNQQCVEISKEAALAHAMPPAAAITFAKAPEPTDAEDLQLAAFTRPARAETTQAAGVGFDLSLAERVRARIRQTIADLRQGIFQHGSDDSGGYPSGAGLLQAGGGSDFQEPSLTRFTRRST